MIYENLLSEAECDNLYIIENVDFESDADGLIHGSVIGINSKVHSSRKRACVLAEELGHYYTTVGDIIDQSKSENRKQEYRARFWAYNKLIGLSGIISAYKAKCQNLYEMAEHLDVTEEFLKEALICYKSKYGICAKLDNYIIYFEPNLVVLEMI